MVTPTVDSDQAVFGLMAMHILKGEFPLIQWGFPYMSSGESFFAAPFFYFLGASPFTLDLAIAIESLIFVWLIFFVGRRIGGSQMGLLSALYVAIPPSYLAIHCVLARGAYIETLILGTLAFWMALRIFYPEGGKDRGPLSYFLLGTAFGLGLWFHFLIIFFMVPIGFFFLIKPKTLFRKEISLLVLGFLLGSLPFWVHNFYHGFEGIAYLSRHEKRHHTFWQGLSQYVGRDLCIILGMFRDHIQTALTWVNVPFIILYAAFLVYGWGQWLKSFFHKEPLKGIGLVLIFLLFYILIVDESEYIEKDTRRYYVPLFAGLPLLWAWVVQSWSRRSRVLKISLVSAFLFFHLFTNFREAAVFHPDSFKPYQEKVRKEKELIHFLEEKNLRQINYEDYWLGFRLNFIAQEKIIFARTFYERYRPYEDILERSDHPVFLDGASQKFGPLFKIIGGSCEENRVGDWSVYHDFVEPQGRYRQVNLQNAHVSASDRTEEAKYVLDRDAETAWTSGRPRSPGMWVQIDLGRTYSLGLLRLWDRPHHFRDTALQVSVQVSLNGEEWKEVIPPTRGDFYYWNGPRIYGWELGYRSEARLGPVQARFIRITGHEADSQHPWMIYEIFVYEHVGEERNVKDQPRVIQAIQELKLEKVYADRWLSSKIKEDTQGKVQTVEPFSYPHFYGEMPSRLIEWGPHVGFAVEDADAEQFEKEAQQEGFNLSRRDCGRWSLFYFSHWGGEEEEMGKVPSFWWTGFGILKTNRKLRSEYLGIRARKYAEKGDWASALRYDEKALERYSNHQGVRWELIQVLEKLGRLDEAQEQLEELKWQTEPREKMPILFEKGVEFLGFSIESHEAHTGQTLPIYYYWRLNQDPGSGMGVFVHLKGPGPLIQGDHKFLDRNMKVWPALEGEIFYEEELLKIPEVTPPGQYEIWLGLFDLGTERRWKVKKTELKENQGAVFVGRIQVK